MALSVHMPSTGCEHLDATSIKKIQAFRAKSTKIDTDFATYCCLSCDTIGGFSLLDKHFSKAKHDLNFAISSNSVYCGKCADLVYDAALLVKTGKAVSAISSKPVTNGIKRKLAETSEEDDSYLTANTSQRPCGRSGVRGLFNLGETCYMNAVLQMMVHNPLLASYFLGMGHSVHICPISKEPDKDKKYDSDDEEAEDDSRAGDDKKERQTCVACGMTETIWRCYDG